MRLRVGVVEAAAVRERLAFFRAVGRLAHFSPLAYSLALTGAYIMFHAFSISISSDHASQ